MKNLIILLFILFTTNLSSQRQIVTPLSSPCKGCDLSNVHINFNHSVTEGCEVIFVTYLANLPENCNGEYSYDFGDGSPISSGHSIDPTCATHEYSGNGTFQVCMTYKVSNGCSISKCIDVTVVNCDDCSGCDDCSVCDLTVSGPTIGSSNGTTVAFNSGTSSSGICTNLTREYDYGDGTTGTSYIHSYGSPGSYNVCITVTVTGPNNLECSETSCNTIWIGRNPVLYGSDLVLNDNKDNTFLVDDDLSVYPNPVREKVNINIDLPNYKALGVISIIDSNGKVMLVEKINQPTEDLNINLSNFSKGLYFIKYENMKGEVIFKRIQKI